jgi:hypothetical protein
MKFRMTVAAIAALLSPGSALAAEGPTQHFSPIGGVPTGAMTPGLQGPAFSSAVLSGGTLYIAGTTDMDRTTGKPPADGKLGAKLVMDSIKSTFGSQPLRLFQ